MSRRASVVVRKTVRDFSRPLWLAAFFVLYLPVATLFAKGATDALPEDLGNLPLHVQEQTLLDAFVQLSFVWALGIPMMVLCGVLVASAVATETERETIHILLSKPIRRWEVLLGKFVAVTVFTLLTMVAGMLVGGSLIYHLSGASPAAIGGGIGAPLPGNLVYAVVVSLLVGGVATAAAVVSGRRLRTALAGLSVPVLFFAFIFTRLVAGDLYEDYHLYLLDVNYHLGNAYVVIHGAVGTDFSPSTQIALTSVSGVYDAAGAGIDPLVGGMTSSVPLAGHVAPVASFAVLVSVSVGLVVGAVARFERMDLG